jgi:hypothetical protein
LCFFLHLAVGKVPGETEHILGLFNGKRPTLSTAVPLKDGEQDLYESLDPKLSAPSQSTLWLHQDGLFLIKALESEDMSFPVAQRLLRKCNRLLLIDKVMRLWIPLESSTQWGSLSVSALVFFPLLGT